MCVISGNRLAIVATSLAYVLKLDSSVCVVSTKQPVVAIREEPSVRVGEQWHKLQASLEEDDKVKHFLYTSTKFRKDYLGAYFLGRKRPNNVCLLLLDLEGKSNLKLQSKDVQCVELDQADTSTFVVSNINQDINSESVVEISLVGLNGKPNKTVQLYQDSKNTLNISTKSSNSSESGSIAWRQRDGGKYSPTAAFYYEGHYTRMTVFFYPEGSVEIYEDSNLRYKIDLGHFIECQIPVPSTIATTTNTNVEPVTSTEESENASWLGWIVLLIVLIFVLVAIFYYMSYLDKSKKKKDKERRRKNKTT